MPAVHHPDYYESLSQRISHLRRRLKRVSLLRGLLIWTVCFLILSFLAVAAEALFHFSPIARTILIASVLVALLAAAIWYVGKPLQMLLQPAKPDDITLALEVGWKFPEIRDRLADALEVYHITNAGDSPYSRELAVTSLEEIFHETRNVDFSEVADTAEVRKLLKPAGGAAVLLLLLVVLFPLSAKDALVRLSHPSQAFDRGPTFQLAVSPGNVRAIKGDDVTLHAAASGSEIPEISLFTKSAGSEERQRHIIRADAKNEFSYTVHDIREDLEYFFAKDKVKSPGYTITVVERPLVRSLKASVVFPAYSKLGTEYLDENVGDVAALRGSRVRLNVQANKDVATARIVFQDSTSLPMKVVGKEITGEFKVRRPGTYHIALKDESGLQNSAPIDYRVEVVEDQVPFVQITYPGQDVDLSKDMILPLTIEAQDDFGFSALRLRFKILRGGFQEESARILPLSLPESAQDRFLLNYNWDMRGLGLSPGDAVSYFVEVLDNDRVSGPKDARSETYRARFPSIYEIFDEVAESQDETYDDLQDIYEESKSLKTLLDEVVQEMKRNPDLNWEEKQNVQEAARAQKQMQEKLQEMQQNLDEMVNRLDQNDLLSPETLQKYRELQQLMQELLTEDLKQAIAELQKKLEDMDPQKMKEAVDKFSESQEEFLRGMERTVNLLKKLQIEQKLDEAVRKTQDLVRRQEELNQKAASEQAQGKKDKYAQEQQGIKKDTEALSSDLKDLKKRMQEFPQMPSEAVQQAEQQSGEQLPQEMQETAQQFQQGDMQGAQQSGQQISEGMQEMLQSLQSARQEMSEKQKQKVMQALRRSSHDLLTLSEKQEELMDKTKGTDRNTPGMNELADNQQDLLSGLSRVSNQLFELSQETFFVTPEIGQALGKSVSGMQEALKQMEARNSRATTQRQAQAMSALNEAVNELHNSMQSLSGASSGIGFQEMMQRLMGISNQQMQINQQTSRLGEQPGMSMEQQAALQRLAAEQAALKKSLEQLEQEYKNRSEILGDLGKVSEDMAEVVNDLMQKNVRRKTIERQKEILSRLLDAQRSMHTRDFSNKRKSESGKQIFATSPAELSQTGKTEAARLRSELLRALKEGYSKDYQELIQKYFDALAKEELRNGSRN